MVEWKAKEWHVSPIRYRHYHHGAAFNDELNPFMHKRLGFAYEREVRLLKYNERHYFDLAATSLSDAPNTIDPPELPEHIFFDWPPAEVIEKFTISPYAHEAYEKAVKDQIQSIDPSLVERLELSVLSKRRYAPQF
jgi:hypothetical protein